MFSRVKMAAREAQTAKVQSGARRMEAGGQLGAAAGQRWSGPEAPAGIPAELAMGPAAGRQEAEADAMAARVAGGPERTRRADGWDGRMAPGIVRQVLRSPGQALDASTRARLEPELGRDLGGVRVHTGPEAAESARAVGARAYTVGRDAVFGAGAFDARSREGLRLVAHEVSHAVQQTGGGPGLSASGAMVARDPDDKKTDPPKGDPPKAGAQADDKDKKTQTIVVSPQDLLLPKITAPVKPGAGNAGGGTGTGTPVPNLSPSQITTPPTAPLAPTGTPVPASPVQQPGAATGGGASSAPSRLSVADIGLWSLGLRINFPDLPQLTLPGAGPSALQESLKKGEILNFMMTGQPPSEYSLDIGKLVGAAWGIYSTRIDPAMAAKIAAKAGGAPKKGPFSATVDGTLLISGKGGGGGVSLTLTF